MGHYLSEFYSIPPPKTKCKKSKNGKHTWTSDVYYRKKEKHMIEVTPTTRPNQHVFHNFMFCKHCQIGHQP